MTYEQFLGKLISINVHYEEPTLDKYNYHRKNSRGERGPAQIQVQWRTGGQSGGSCWDVGEHHHYPIEGDPEPEFEDLEKILDNFCPNMGRNDYKQLCGKLIERSTECEGEYYGNYTNYGIKTVKCRELFEYLVQKELISNEI